jgi:hypothetical protein
MLQALPPIMEAHNHAMKLSDRRALQINAQHPQRAGAGKMGRKKMDMDNTHLEQYESGSDEEHDKNLKGGAHSAPSTRLARLVGGAKKNKKALLEKVGEKEMALHKLEHRALESDAALQGGMLARHLEKEHGKQFLDDFKRGLGGLSGGNMDLISGAVDNGRVNEAPPSFERNTVGMGKSPSRHSLAGLPGGEYHGASMTGCGKKRRAKAGPSDARRQRGAEVSRLMREEGMTLGEASKHIKEHGY